MPKMHSLVYFVVGVFVSIVSLKINYGKLYLFFYAGLVFILIGIVKTFNLIKNRITKPEVKHSKPYDQARQLKYCHNCGNPVRMHQRFCSKCGNSLL